MQFGSASSNEFIEDVITVSGISGYVTDLDVEMQIGHTWVSDLDIQLSYGGTTIQLIDRQGSSGDNVDVTFR